MKMRKLFKNSKITSGGKVDFGGLWIDSENGVDARIKQSPKSVQSHLQKFVKDGYTVFENAVPVEVVDQILEDIKDIYRDPTKFVYKNQGVYTDPCDLEKMDRADRLIESFAISAAARAAIGCKPVTEFLNTIFDDDPIAMQSIYFEYGSQQAIHQDTAYVVSSKPLSLAAAWIALEDVTRGSGELIYYPGSQQYNHFLFSGEHKNWTPARDGADQHKEFLKSLHKKAKDQGIEVERFLAKKGDILIWHADLAHGGSVIQDDKATRRSLVAHFVPKSVGPRYREHVEDTFFEYEGAPGMYFTARHYDLRPLSEGQDAKLIYDGGVTKRRNAK